MAVCVCVCACVFVGACVCAEQAQLQGHATCVALCTGTYALKDAMLSLMLFCSHLEFFLNFEHGILHFTFVLDPTNYVASPGTES